MIPRWIVLTSHQAATVSGQRAANRSTLASESDDRINLRLVVPQYPMFQSTSLFEERDDKDDRHAILRSLGRLPL